MSLTEIKQEIEEDISREIAIAGRIKKESNFDEPIEDLGDNDIDHDEINATIKSEEEQSNYNHDEEEDEDEPNDNINQCKVCKTIFSTRADLRKHHRVKGKKLDICCLCKKTFRLGGGALGIHQRIHTGAKPYECDVCKKKFSLRGNMVKHKISMHTDQRAFECDVCKKKFKQLAHLQQHKEVHSGTSCKKIWSNLSERRTLSSIVKDIEMTDDEESHNSVQGQQFDISDQQQSFTSINHPASSSSIKYSDGRRSRRNRKEEICFASALLMKYLSDQRYHQIEEDEIDIFFSGIALTVKKLSCFNQTAAKSKIFNVVSQIELQELSERQNCYNHSNDQPTSSFSYNTRNNNTSLSVTQQQSNPQYNFIDLS